MNILFVCTGNTCRSPMAEGILKKIASDDGQKLNVLSVGLGTQEGFPSSENAVTAMKMRDIDISKHRTHEITPELVRDSDIIIAMTSNHRDYIIRNFENSKDKTVILGDGIPDPYGGSLDDYIKTADAIEAAVKKLKENGAFTVK